MKIVFLMLGKTSQESIDKLIGDYEKRILHYADFSQKILPTAKVIKSSDPVAVCWTHHGVGFVKFRRYLLSHFWYYHRLWKLNYRVRDGNGCDLSDMFTGKFPYMPPRRHVVRGRGNWHAPSQLLTTVSFRSTRYEWSSIRPLVPVS